MAPVGARKGWEAVSGKRLAFYTTKKMAVKVKSGKLEMLHVLLLVCHHGQHLYR